MATGAGIIGTLDIFERLGSVQIDTENVEPLSYPTEGSNIFREDICKPSIDREQALKNAPEQDGEFFKVPKVIGGA